MAGYTTQRTASPEEQHAMAAILRASSFSRLAKEGAENALVMWAATLLATTLFWLALSWLLRKLLGIDIGPQSASALWILAINTLLCGVIALISTHHWLRRRTRDRPLLTGDALAGVVDEEHHAIVDLKRFAEPEHGGLIYFLLSNDGRVLVAYDHESQDLACQDRDPLSSNFRPHSEFVVVRMPQSRHVLHEGFGGLPLPLPTETHELTVGPSQWPESGDICNVPWQELEQHFAG